MVINCYFSVLIVMLLTIDNDHNIEQKASICVLIYINAD